MIGFQSGNSKIGDKMIFNIAFVVSSTYLKLIWATGNYDHNTFANLEDLPGWDIDDNANIFRDSSSGGISGSKRLKTELVSVDRIEKASRKYYKASVPLDPKIDDNKVKILRKYEEQLLAKGKRCKWDKFKDLTKEDAKNLCINAWEIQAQRVPDIIKQEDTIIPDCEPYPASGSGSYTYIIMYKVYLQYLDKVKDNLLYPELMRCNCAYIRKIIGTGIHRTVNRSKKYFFLYKLNDTTYYIFSAFGPPADRNVKLIDVNELNVCKP